LNLEAVPEGTAAHSTRPGGRAEGSKWLRFATRRPRALRLPLLAALGPTSTNRPCGKVDSG